MCEMACSFRHEGFFSQRYSRITVKEAERGVFEPLICLLLTDPDLKPLCVEACKTGALSVVKPGFIKLDENRCVGCGECAEVCPVGVIRLLDNKPLICDACGGLPECVLWCPQGALRIEGL